MAYFYRYHLIEIIDIEESILDFFVAFGGNFHHFNDVESCYQIRENVL